MGLIREIKLLFLERKWGKVYDSIIDNHTAYVIDGIPEPLYRARELQLFRRLRQLDERINQVKHNYK